MKFSDLQALFTDGALTEETLLEENVSPGDFLKMRQDCGRFETADFTEKPGKLQERTYKYVFVTESAIGHFKDLPLADSWNLESFRERKSPVLFGHDDFATPIGRALTVRKGVELDGVKAMVGHVEFAPKGISEHVDLVEDMVANGFLNGGSVGFDINEAREPTKTEIDKFGLGKYSSVFTDSDLIEYSVVSLGRDPKAGVVYTEEGAAQFEVFLSENAERYSADAVREVRETILCKPTGRASFALREWFETDETLDAWNAGGDLSHLGNGVTIHLGDTTAREQLAALTERVATLEAATNKPEITPVEETEEEETLFGVPMSRVVELCKELD